MSRCVIVGGADIKDYPAVRAYLREDDFIVYCDSGLRHLNMLGVPPDLIVGDFDSHENPGMDVETIVLPREKDDTDTVFAAKEALKRGFDDFLLIGAVGGRLDHTLANVFLLLWLDNRGKTALAVDDYSEMKIVSRKTEFIEEKFAFFSLLNITGLARGITVKNAKYPLTNAEISSEYQYGVSNEVLPHQVAEVSLTQGQLLLIKERN